jgi:hypothetical protein
MNPNKFRTILPAIHRRPPTLEPEPRSKRAKRGVPCDACRDKRTGCDGQRPLCAACVKRGSECAYVNDEGEMRPIYLERENIALREKVDAFNQLIQLLKTLATAKARGALQRFITGSDPVAMLQTPKGEATTASPSEQELVRCSSDTLEHI